MSRAVLFDEYGDVDVLDVRTVPQPVPAPGEVLVEVREASPSGRVDALLDSYPPDEVHDAYRDLERRLTRGKLVLLP